MTGPTSITEIDLAPVPGKTYWNTMREWREESIYGKGGCVTVQSHPDSSLFVQLELAPMQFVILQ